jgi:lysyl-tRNA synthetase class 2
MTDAGTIDWRPSASRARLAQRAELLAATRGFFGDRGLLEVETPMLVGAAVTDTHLESVPARVGARTMYLHTSPEYAMKRLLAAGSGDIWQLCRVARGDERSRLHNPEFTLLEWYRCGWSMAQLIDEVAALFDALCLRAGAARRPLVVRRYADAFRDLFGVDPLTASDAALGALARDAGLENGTAGHSGVTAPTRDDLLDFLVGAKLGPTLGRGGWLALTHWPASQAALARLDPADPRTALRFEVYADGIELANGFEELADAREQAARFAADNAARRARGLPEHAADARLLAALAAGLPPCSGVAVGFDRAVMVATGARSIDEVIAFTTEQA